MKRILAALDFTAHADRAFARAVQLATQHDAELTLAHVIRQDLLTYEDAAGPSLSELARARADRKLRDYSAPAALKVNFRLTVGDPAREISMLVGEVGADLAILGVHHEKPIIDVFVNTTAYCTIQQCGIPFLIVREPTRGPYRRVLAPTDFSLCARRSLRSAIAVAPEAEFHVLHVYETPFPQFVHFSEKELKEYQQERLFQIERDVQEEMRDFVARHTGHPFPEIKPLLEHDDTDAGIRRAAKRLQPDLLAMGLSGRGFAALIGSRTTAYLNAPFCDLLVTA